jgi:hypothetical protein
MGRLEPRATTFFNAGVTCDAADAHQLDFCATKSLQLLFAWLHHQ